MAGGCPTSPQPPQRAKWRQAATGAVAGTGCRQPGGGSPIPAGEAPGCRAGLSAPGPAACSSAERLPQPGRPPEPASLLTAPSGSICQPPPPQLRHVPGTRRVLGPADELRGEEKRGQGCGRRAGTPQPFLAPGPAALLPGAPVRQPRGSLVAPRPLGPSITARPSGTGRPWAGRAAGRGPQAGTRTLGAAARGAQPGRPHRPGQEKGGRCPPVPSCPVSCASPVLRPQRQKEPTPRPQSEAVPYGWLSGPCLREAET